MTLRVAIVGLGWAARSIWLPQLGQHPAFEVAAVVDPNPVARASFARQGSDIPVFTDVDELPANMVDLTVVAVPNYLHCAVACQLLVKGLAIFLEKPVCLSSAEADQLAAAEHAGGAVLLAGSAARYRTDVRALYSLAETLGKIRHVELAWVRARGVPDAGGWFTHRRLAGGGALVDLGWHLLDVVSPLLGSTTVEQVVGTVSADFVNNGNCRAAWRQDHAAGLQRGDGGDVEDTARGFLVTDDGVSVFLRTSWASHEAHDVTTIKIEGTAGTATLRCTFGFSPHRQCGSALWHIRDGESVPVAVTDEPIGSEYCRQLDHLPVLLADPASRGRAIREARRTIGAIERVYESAQLRELGGASIPVLAPARRQLRAVIFDLDGVLVDSFEVMREAFTIAYAEVVGPGRPPFEEYSRHLGRYFPDIMRIMELPPEMEVPFVRESYRLAHRVTLFDGVVDTVRTLRERGLRLAVATGKSGPRARSLLDQLGVLSLFDHVIGSDEVARPKPAPDIVVHALDRLGVAPQDAVMIGDSVADLASASSAGVTAVAALWGEADEDELIRAQPHAVLREPGELLSWCY
ncbi:MAG: HAD-IA family hydrolase [Pseudonocardiaceae bacterium]